MSADQPLYWPFYCEENIWHSCRAGLFDGAEVLFISNPRRAVALWFQRAAPDENGPVIWDYHVVLAVPGPGGTYILDFDTRLGTRINVGDYLERTFAGTSVLPPEHAPRFRVVAADRYRDSFSSDRAHMRRADGTYSAAPPPWAPIGSGPSNLMRFVDMTDGFEGEVLDLVGLRNRYGVGDAT